MSGDYKGGGLVSWCAKAWVGEKRGGAEKKDRGLSWMVPLESVGRGKGIRRRPTVPTDGRERRKGHEEGADEVEGGE